MNYQSRVKKNNSFLKQIAWTGFFVFIVTMVVRGMFPGMFNTFGNLLVTEQGFISKWQTNFSNKKDLVQENKLLRDQIKRLQTDNVFSLSNQQAYNNLYKTISTDERSVVTAEVLLRPPVAAYDTYILAAGSVAGIELGQMVSVGGVYAVGYIDAVTSDYARVRLFSSATHAQTVSIDGYLFDSVGQGSGSIAVRLPRSYVDTSNQSVQLPGASNLSLGIVSLTEFDPQDSYVTGIITPVHNIFQTELVTVLSQKWVDVAALDLEQFNNTQEDEENTDSE